MGRLVPFSVFVLVPFAELLLPVALKLFPNMLPSTYEGIKSKEAKAKSLRATRKDVSTFLRETMRESGLPVSATNAQREEFTEFFRKVGHSFVLTITCTADASLGAHHRRVTHKRRRHQRLQDLQGRLDSGQLV